MIFLKKKYKFRHGKDYLKDTWNRHYNIMIMIIIIIFYYYHYCYYYYYYRYGKDYWKDNWNCLDMAIVLFSFACTVLRTGIEELKMLRLVKTFRIIRVFRNFTSANRIINALYGGN